MDEIYNINWDNFILDNVPIEQRQPITLKWFKVVFKPIARLHLEFLAFRNQALYKVNHNSQICYLQAVLNDSFDNVFRRIVIKNAVVKSPLWFYEPEENKPVTFYEPSDNKPVYFREEWQLIGDGADFTVLVPVDLKPNTSQEENALLIKMKAQIDYYKLFVKNYKVVWV